MFSVGGGLEKVKRGECAMYPRNNFYGLSLFNFLTCFVKKGSAPGQANSWVKDLSQKQGDIFYLKKRGEAYRCGEERKRFQLQKDKQKVLYFRG